MKVNLGRLLLALGLGVLVLLFAWEAMSADLAIIEVRRNIPLADNDPIYRDFYLNAGVEAGLKPNQVVTAVRKISIKDASGTQAFGEVIVPVGQLKIIFAQNRIAVAREYKLLDREDLPMLEQASMMTGDLIDLKGSFIDTRKPTRKTASAQDPRSANPAVRVQETPAPAKATAKVDSQVAEPENKPKDSEYKEKEKIEGQPEPIEPQTTAQLFDATVQSLALLSAVNSLE